MKQTFAVLLIWVSSLTSVPGQLPADEFSAVQLELFEKHIRPLLVEHCLQCHGPQKQEGGLNLSTRELLLRGGDSGAAIMAGRAAQSLLVEAVEYLSEPKMPPSGKLSAEKIEHVRRWVESGAAWPANSPLSEAATTARGFRITEKQQQWWAFKPRSDAHPPQVRASDWPHSELDHFVLAKLDAAGVAPATAADRVTWLRRATFDLTGLPPSPQDVSAFLYDASNQAFENVINRLLDSPAYGERWARHWLDVVRYADYHDFNPGARVASCEITEAWRYRDWVVAAFNRDMPFDQFIEHQIAGDLLPSPDGEEVYADGLVATTFLSNGVWDRGDADKEKIVSDMVDDNIGVIGRAFLGLTLDCARCHDHKFDPISTEDYYGLAGMFYSSHILKELGVKGGEYNVNRVPLIGPAAIARRADEEKRLAELTAKLAELDRQRRFEDLTRGGRPLVPTSFKSDAGATTTIADDGTISVTGNLARDRYVIDAVIGDGAASSLPATGGPARRSITGSWSGSSERWKFRRQQVRGHVRCS
ncbi:MAG UNVERIFIED_CONTAM: DUF1549 domain-containing protein [Planctomycetaceae bacterium]|jgi:hypothetical protein